MVDDTQKDDGIIELIQVVEEDFSDTPDQEVVELTDIDTQILEPRENGLDLDLDFDLDETGANAFEAENRVAEPVLVMESRSEESRSEEQTSEEPTSNEPTSGETISEIESTITQEQVEAALERVIEKKFAKKIEKILFEVMEKVLEQEIVDIRKRLQKDLDELTGS